jgi:hypothetical protein
MGEQALAKTELHINLYHGVNSRSVGGALSGRDQTVMTESRGLHKDDPLLVLLRRYESGLKAFNELSTSEKGDEYWDKLAEDTWYGAQQEIICSKPSATTVAGALRALDYVLQSDELFGDLSVSADLQMLRQLIKGARDFVASLGTRNS